MNNVLESLFGRKKIWNVILIVFFCVQLIRDFTNSSLISVHTICHAENYIFDKKINFHY